MNRLSLKKMLILIVMMELSVMALVLWVQQKNVEITSDFSSFYGQFDHLHHLADYLRQSSDDLTRFARMHVSTGNHEYQQNFNKITQIRNGEAPLPKDATSTYWNLNAEFRAEHHPATVSLSFLERLRHLPFSEQERAMLLLSYQRSEQLAVIETKAFELFQPVHLQQSLAQNPALELLYSKEYLDAKHQVMEPLNRFYHLLHERLHDRKHQVEQALQQNAAHLWMAILLFVVINILSMSLLYRQIVRSNRELKDSELFLSSILDSTLDAIITINEQGRIQTMNKAAETLTGYRKDELLGQLPDIFVPKALNIRHEKLIGDYLRTGERKAIGKTLEHELVRKDGSLVPISLKVGEILFDNKRVFTALLYDITERKEYEKSLLEAKQNAENLARTKSDFLANMSHEIRTPMNAILGMLNLALLDQTLTEKTKNFIFKANHSAEMLLRIINDILDFSKIEAAQLRIEKTPFSMWDVLEDLVDVIRLSASNKGIELMYSMDPKMPTDFVGDPLRIGQILLNLTSNAIKFTPENGQVLVTISLDKTWFDDSNQQTKCLLRGVVKDSGIGMSEVVLSKVFKAFSQADTSTTRKFGGTGLGLVITQKLVEMMNGTISVTSQEGSGSEFSFTLELAQQTQDSKMTKKLSSLLGELNILVVEDNETSRLILSKMLESFGFKTEMVASGEQAITLLHTPEKAQIFDIIIMDWMMEGMDGIETIKYIQDTFTDYLPKIIMVTAHSIENLAEVSQDVLIHHFITKPITYSNVYDAIIETVDESGKGHKFNKLKDQHERVANLARKLYGAKLLLVEDNHINQELMVELMATQQIHIQVANHGKEALEMIQAENFDGVLMDCQMPVMDGFEATRALRAMPNYQSLPIIAVTANALDEDRDKALASGMNDVVTKPIRPEELFACMVKWIVPSHPVRIADLSDSKVEQAVTLPKTIAGIEIDKGLITVNHNKPLYLKLLSKFKDSQADFVRRFNQSVNNQDWSQATLLAHSLKGLAGNIGAMHLYQQAQALERAAQQQMDQTELNQLVNILSLALNEVLEGLQQVNFAPTRPAEAIADWDKAAFLSQLLQLEKLLQEDDVQAVHYLDEIVSQLPATQLDALQDLIRSVRGYAFEQALLQLQQVQQLMKAGETP